MTDTVWHGREAEVKVADALSTVAEEEALATQITDGTDYTGEVMDITITDPEASIDLENTFGGQFKVQTPSDLVEIEVTMKFADQGVFEELHGEATTYTDADSNERYRISGSKSPGNRPEKAFLFRLRKQTGTDGSGNPTYDEVEYMVNNALFQQAGELSLDADGFTEITGTVVALVEDREIDQNF